jgi:hypothetical protein
MAETETTQQFIDALQVLERDRDPTEIIGLSTLFRPSATFPVPSQCVHWISKPSSHGKKRRPSHTGQSMSSSAISGAPACHTSDYREGPKTNPSATGTCRLRCHQTSLGV